MHRKKHPFIIILNLLLFALILLFYYTNNLVITIKGISPLLILPLLAAFSIFHPPIISAIVGLIAGIFMDSCVVGSYCFNAITLLVIAAFVSVSSSNLFNKNIQSASVLSLITCAFYYVALWLCFHNSNVSLTDSLIYLLKYAFPSAIFSSVFIIPFYFIYKHFHKITSE